MPTLTLNKTSLGQRRKLTNQKGFSLLEMVVAMLILTVGFLGVACAVGYALLATNRGRGITNAKLLVVTAQEQMETLRDTGQLTFAEISNSHVTGSSFTHFPTDFMPVSEFPGPDGIYGTNDDLVSPGPDGFYFTPDDFTDESRARPNVTRQILIAPIPNEPLLKKITVTVRYASNGGETRELVGISYLNDDARGNYVP
jgi:prepilin-type N-terminal cleavage/methylation domain-containing protein